MEIELNTMDGKIVTFYGMDYIRPAYNQSNKVLPHCQISSGGKIFDIDKGYYEAKNIIRDSVILELQIVKSV